jgi:hypothetical protein
MERELINDNIRGLVISDLHFTQDPSLKLALSLPTFLRTLTQIICDKRVNLLFILGDVIEQVHQDANIADFQVILAGLDILSVPVYLLPGEHDRAFHHRLRGQYDWTNIFVIYETFACLKNPHPRRGTYPNIFLTHSGGTGGKPSGSVKEYLHAMKEKYTQPTLEIDEPISPTADPKDRGHGHHRPKGQFKNIMTMEDFLLVGNCHKHEQVANENVASLDQFSVDGKGFFYALITSDGAFHFEFSSLPYSKPKSKSAH